MMALAAEGVEVVWWSKCEEEEEGEEEEYEYEEESVNVDTVLSRSSLERAMERAPETAVCITHTTMVLNSRTVTKSTGVYTIVQLCVHKLHSTATKLCKVYTAVSSR